jgi:hypothetical protein
LALLLLIVCLATTYWLKTGGFRTGLFEECTDREATSTPLPSAPRPGECTGANRSRAYIKIVAAMLIIAGLITLAAIVLNVLGLSSKDFHRKYLYYKIATYLALIAVLLELVSLVVFPVCFYLEMQQWGQRDWEFDWSYGVAWGATLFTFGASLLLICDKEHEEIYYKEKTIYSPPPELK